MGGRRVTDAVVRRDAGGYILMYVLGALLFLTIIGFAVIAMTYTATNVSTSMLETTANIHSLDSALEEAVNSLRLVEDDAPDADPSATEQRCPLVGIYVDTESGKPIDVDCETSGPEGLRTVRLDANIRGGDVTAQAVVRFHDSVDGRPNHGFRVEVCDWRLGRNATAPQECP